MELLRHLFAIIFYILFFCWAFFKIRNAVLVNKLNCKEIYKEIKKEAKKQRISKYLFRISLATIIIFAVYLVSGLVSGVFALFMIFITLGGTAYIYTGADSTFYDNLMKFVGNYFSLFKYKSIMKFICFSNF